MLTLHTKETVKSFDGSDIIDDEGNPLTLGRAVAMILNNTDVAGKKTLYNLAKKFWNDEEVELGASDLEVIEKATEKTTLFTAVVCGYILETLAEATE